jgi:hypothetical protein
VSNLPSLWRDKALQLLAAGLVWGMTLVPSPGWAAQGDELAVSVTSSVTAPVAEPIADGAWRIEFSPYTHHFRYNADHKDVWALGLERETADHSLFGLMAFSNSFGQPSAYAYYGRTFSPVERWSESLYVKLTGGLLYGYLPPYSDRVPFNYNGYSPAIIPAIGWRLDKTLSVQMNFLGTAAVMLMVNKKF